MAPQETKPSGAANGEAAGEEALPIGPPSGLAAIPTQYLTEHNIRQMLRSIRYDVAREDNYRLKGVQLIDTVRESLQLPVKTFDTAAIYYHKFRIRFPSSEYSYEDVALATLFTACKVEDTIKKSREILCAAHNLRHQNDRKTPDDKAFEQPSRFTVGLERHILETVGFDFRVPYPQKLLSKFCRKLSLGGDSTRSGPGKRFFETAWDMSIDVYKTFAPIKHTSAVLALAILRLTALFLGQDYDKVRQLQSSMKTVGSSQIYETMMDLLDLYTQFPKSTKVGTQFDFNKVTSVKLDITKSMDAGGYQRFKGWCGLCGQDATDPPPQTPGSARSPATNNSAPTGSSVRRKGPASEGTLRFVFDADEARAERDTVSRYFDDVYEEYEVEVEEAIRDPPPRQPANAPRNSFPHRHGPRNDHGWGPYNNRGRPGPSMGRR